ncbi:hypothetical protein ACU635_45025 [[Actinomadura] parvosata]|uniref:hypothetical protein n=1 Tax=[Actinomadura] parvosata TaxID=1955412 RepID=UPI00406C61A1
MLFLVIAISYRTPHGDGRSSTISFVENPATDERPWGSLCCLLGQARTPAAFVRFLYAAVVCHPPHSGGWPSM